MTSGQRRSAAGTSSIISIGNDGTTVDDGYINSSTFRGSVAGAGQEQLYAWSDYSGWDTDPDIICWHIMGSAFVGPVAVAPQGYIGEQGTSALGTSVVLSSDHAGEVGSAWVAGTDQLRDHHSYITTNWPGIQIVGSGHSSGAHLIALLAHEFGFPFLAVSGIYTYDTMWDSSGGFDVWATNSANWASTPADDWKESNKPPPSFAVQWSKNTPQCFLIGAPNDNVVRPEQTLDAVAACETLGIRAWHQEPTGSADGHFPDDKLNMDAIRDWYDRWRRI